LPDRSVSTKRRREERPITAGPHDRANQLESDAVPARSARLEEVPVDIVLRQLSRNPWRF